jgi:hypothetical protein
MKFKILPNKLAQEKEVTIIILHEDVEVMRFPVKAEVINIQMDEFQNKGVMLKFVVIEKDIKPFSIELHVKRGMDIFIKVEPEFKKKATAGEDIINVKLKELQDTRITPLQDKKFTVGELIEILKDLPKELNIGHSSITQALYWMTKDSVVVQDQVLVSKGTCKSRWIKPKDINKYTGWKIERFEKIVFFKQSCVD